MEVLNKLNEKQREIVLNSLNRDSLVVASAGSGKTTLLITRVQYLLTVKKVKADNICCITFTRKAADELLERAVKAIGDDAYNMWVGTFHSICIRILRLFGEDIGLDERFTILSPYYAKKQTKDILNKIGATTEKDTIKSFMKRISTLKNNLKTPRAIKNALLKRNRGDYEAYQKDRDYSFYEYFNTFQKENINNNILDFDDILLYIIILLKKSKNAQKFIKDNFRYVCCDEFQDSNTCNYQFLELLTKNCNLFCVGDGDQSIYEFRGAKPKYLLNFEKRDNTRVFKLEQNYRSTQTIVNASNFLIEKNEDRVDKTSFSMSNKGEKIKIGITANSRAEAYKTSQEIKKIINKGYKYDDIYILFRVNSQMSEYEKVFIENNIPYCLVGHKNFCERKEIIDLLAYIKVMTNYKDKQSLKRVLSQVKGIGAKRIEEIMLLVENENNIIKGLKLYKDNQKVNEKIEGLILFITNKNLSPYDVLNKLGNEYIESFLSKDKEENNTKIDNINALIGIAKEKEDKTLLEFIEEMDLSSSGDKKTEEGKVSFLTMHSVKGLESDVVFIAGCSESIVPHSISVLEGKIESERRLFYVAMTRARKLLYLNYHKYEYNDFLEPTRFLSDIPIEFFEKY